MSAGYQVPNFIGYPLYTLAIETGLLALPSIL